MPLFALANAGIQIGGDFLARAFTSPVTLGILFGYVLGKPIGIAGSGVARRQDRAEAGCAPPVGWAAVTGAGALAGIGFTVSLLIASLAFSGDRLEEAKVGVLTAAMCASLADLGVLPSDHAPAARAVGPALCSARARPSSTSRSPSIRSATTCAARPDAPVTIVEYGDFECPYCGQAEPVVRELLADFGDVRYVWRHLPLTDVHPHAQLAADAAEAAAKQGRFWQMHDLLLAHQDAL